jgi:hypothetical protein
LEPFPTWQAQLELFSLLATTSDLDLTATTAMAARNSTHGSVLPVSIPESNIHGQVQPVVSIGEQLCLPAVLLSLLDSLLFASPHRNKLSEDLHRIRLFRR